MHLVGGGSVPVRAVAVCVLLVCVLLVPMFFMCMLLMALMGRWHMRDMHAVHLLLERLELMQHLVAVEGADIARLRRGQATHGPAQVHEVRLDWMRQRAHP